MSEQIEQRVFNVENLMSYMAETQRMMAENITKLTESQILFQQRHIEFEQKQAEMQQTQAENDARFNILLAEIRHLSKRVNEE